MESKPDMTAKEKITLVKLDKKIDNLVEGIESIHRGLYGDEKNGSSGIIKKSDDHEKRLIRLETNWVKATFAIIGASFVINILIWILVNLILK